MNQIDELIQEYYSKIPELLGQPRVSFLIGAACSACAGLVFHELNMDEKQKNCQLRFDCYYSKPS